ncbi:hypothetical protein BVC80_1065g157 [Macleaya cordata]|uniref:Uncharacterized protein n=1 Tax=Macleaya cordata TaxID=56857 RepID=A0A200RD14_MACCD|nr:hypothetical protein BVC80_1065g157 [Macleaya cordata]
MDLQATLNRLDQSHQEEEKDKETLMESTEVSAAPPMTAVLMRQTSSGASKTNCLCSPTTHAGSFRCRLHRAPSSTLQRTKSIESSSTLLQESPPKAAAAGTTLETSS